MVVSKTHDNFQNKIKMTNPIQKPSASSKTPNEDLKDINVTCTLKIKLESQNMDHVFIKDQWTYLNIDWDANPGHDPLASSKATNQELKDMDILCTFQINIESQNLEQKYVKDQWPYPNKYQIAKPKVRT